MYTRTDSTSSNGHGKLEAAREQAQTIAKDVSEKVSQLAKQAKPMLDTVEQAIRRKPGSAMLIAAGIGALIALAIHRRR